jgi:hypothetical protein
MFFVISEKVFQLVAVLIEKRTGDVLNARPILYKLSRFSKRTDGSLLALRELATSISALLNAHARTNDRGLVVWWRPA